MIDNWKKIRVRRQLHADNAMRELGQKIAQRDVIEESIETLQQARHALQQQRIAEMMEFEKDMEQGQYQSTLSIGFNKFLRLLEVTDRHVHFQIFELKLALNAARHEVRLAQRHFRNMSNKCEKIDEAIQEMKNVARLKKELVEEDVLEERSMQSKNE